jgi:hypothetical protein
MSESGFSYRRRVAGRLPEERPALLFGGDLAAGGAPVLRI